MAAPAAARGQGGPGRIAFTCPNGNRLIVPATMAGQRGKCSKCGIPVHIPGNAGAAAKPATPASAGSGMPTAVAAGGHDEPASESRVDMFNGLAGADATGGGDSQASASEFLALSSASATSAEPPPFSDAGDGREASAAPPANPTAALVARLFQEVEHGGVVELHLTGGSVILPEFYESRWSGGSHGLFASRAADGTVTLTAVAWDAIQKIVVRQVDGLPDGLFE